MKFCQPHWDTLRVAIDSRGLSALIAESGEQAISNTLSELNNGPTIDNFDPLMSAMWAIVRNLSDIDSSILFMDDCPLCFGNREHAKGCADPSCTGGATYFDMWIERAADDQVVEWKKRGLDR